MAETQIPYCTNTREVLEAMKGINYGWVDASGSQHVSLNGLDFSQNYRLQTPLEVWTSQLGVCWDQVELEREMLRGVPEVHTYCLIYDGCPERPTHTFLTVMGSKCEWLEHAWQDKRGRHIFPSRDELLLYVRDLAFLPFLREEKHLEVDLGQLHLYEYQALPEHGSCEECMEHFSSSKRLY